MRIVVSSAPQCNRLRHLLLVAIAMGFLIARQSQAGGGADAAQVPAELVAAIKQLKTADADGRQKIYDLLAAKGDARLNPALRAYKDGSLLLRDDRLMLFGERETVKDKGSVLPLLDALTHQNVLGPDGQPVYFPRPDLSTAIRAPRLLSEKKAVADLIATLSLLDPDPVVRIASIRDAGERAARAMPDPDDAVRLLDALSKCSAALNAKLATASADEKATITPAIAAIAAAKADRPQSVASPVPGNSSVSAAKAALIKLQPATSSDTSLATTLKDTISATSTYLDHLDARQAMLEELPKTAAALRRQLEKDPKGQFAPALNESIASIELVTSTDSATRIASVGALGKMGTSRAANLLDKIAQAAQRMGDKQLETAAIAARDSANRYQTFAHSVQNTFAGLSLGSILVLLALGLSIIFGLMGVINMA
ncbi:MAG TPA: hypothetical protein VH370_12805, partial [Humisphaera sp.]|nr:hypothetical protein [Humisphaera sp.]